MDIIVTLNTPSLIKFKKPKVFKNVILVPKRDIRSQVSQLICHLICLPIDIGYPEVLKLLQQALYLANVLIKMPRLQFTFLDPIYDYLLISFQMHSPDT